MPLLTELPGGETEINYHARFPGAAVRDLQGGCGEGRGKWISRKGAAHCPKRAFLFEAGID